MTTDGGGVKDYSEKSTVERRYTPGGGGGCGGYMEEEGSQLKEDIFSTITESRIMAAPHSKKVSTGFS
jgi:hypothetical protein